MTLPKNQDYTTTITTNNNINLALHISRINCSYSKHSNTILAQRTCDLSGPKEAQPQLHGLMLH